MVVVPAVVPLLDTVIIAEYTPAVNPVAFADTVKVSVLPLNTGEVMLNAEFVFEPREANPRL
jgi:hypothetical protein